MRIKDLEFKVHPAGLDGFQAIVKFPNGYSASVLTGSLFYTNNESPYEIGILNHKGGLDYNTGIEEGDAVIGYLTEEEANEVLAKIEALPASKDK